MSENQPDPANSMAQAMMQIRAMLEPVHEFLTGEVAWFQAQGFTPEQAREMAVVEYRLLTGQMGGRS